MHQLTWSNGVWLIRPDRGNDLGLWRADSVVEVFECKKTVPFHWDDHYKRMLAACEGHIPMDMLPSEEEILNTLKMLLSREARPYSIVHMQVTPGDSENLKIPLGRPTLTIDVRAHHIQDISPLALCTVQEQRNFPQFKLGSSYGNIQRIRRLYGLEKNGFDSFLYWSERFGILEGPYENIFFVTKNSSLITPFSGVLHGVTRKIIMGLAKDSNLFRQVMSGEVHNVKLEDCAEVFLTSTTKGTAPVRQIDGYKHFKCGDKTYTLKLRKLFLKYRDNYYKTRGA